MIKTISFLTVVILIIAACSSKKEDPVPPPGGGGGIDCNGVNATFAGTVNPIIQGNCTLSGCHDASSVNGPGPLTSYTAVKNASSRIRTVVISRVMPKGGSLSADQIKNIVCWIDSGAPNN